LHHALLRCCWRHAGSLALVASLFVEGLTVNSGWSTLVLLTSYVGWPPMVTMGKLAILRAGDLCVLVTSYVADTW